MPKRNIVKRYGADQYYHCYNRGANKQNIFLDDDDYAYFLSLMKRHLSREPVRDKTRRQYPHYREEVELVAYCLMPNHYHLLLFLKDPKGAEHLMRSVMTSYSRYFNIRYRHSGSVFEGNFLASRISTEQYLWHVSRYIHLNPLDMNEDPLMYKYSSLEYFEGNKQAEWLNETRLVATSAERAQYIKSLSESTEYHQLRHHLLHELADSATRWNLVAEEEVV